MEKHALVSALSQWDREPTPSPLPLGEAGRRPEGPKPGEGGAAGDENLPSVAVLLAEAERAIRLAGADSPRLTALVLLEHASGQTREQLIATPDALLSTAEVAAFRGYASRRTRREPLAYITGWREFYGRRFKVTPATLIPRPETEGLVELALERIQTPVPNGNFDFLDVGTGSGAIAITLLAEVPALRGVATDVHVDSLQITAENAVQHGVSDGLSLLASDLADSLRGRFGLLVANLPYIPSPEMESLEPEVARFEPRWALDGGPNGTALIERLLSALARLLEPEGCALLEIGEGQGERLIQHLERSSSTLQATSRQDPSGRERYLVVEWRR